FTITPPPRLTLFPYTTLFRSLLSVIHHAKTEVQQPEQRTGVVVVQGAAVLGEIVGLTVVILRLAIDPSIHCEAMTKSVVRHGAGDRKSTRLNSSHQIISYAVF